MKIVVDENVPLANELFGCHGELRFVNGRNLSASDLKGASALIIRSVTIVDEALLKGTPIEFVGSCTIGIDHINIQYLNSRNLHWMYAPGCNAQAVVEYVTSALAALDSMSPGQKAAVVGCGAVGGAVFSELKQLGIHVVGYDPFLKPDEFGDESSILTTLEDAMASDIVCFHTPLTHIGPFPTNKMIGCQELSQLNQGAVVISAGRGGVIREGALRSIAEKRPDISWVIDVWANEPGIDAGLFEWLDIGTPHIAGYSVEGKQNGSRQIYKGFCEYFGFVEKSDLVLAEPVLDICGDSIEELILNVYDPRKDSERMREEYRLAETKDRDSGAWFDRLRRNYPERREHSAYRVQPGNLTPDQLETAKALGFSIK